MSLDRTYVTAEVLPNGTIRIIRRTAAALSSHTPAENKLVALGDGGKISWDLLPAYTVASAGTADAGKILLTDAAGKLSGSALPALLPLLPTAAVGGTNGDAGKIPLLGTGGIIPATMLPPPPPLPPPPLPPPPNTAWLNHEPFQFQAVQNDMTASGGNGYSFKLTAGSRTLYLGIPSASPGMMVAASVTPDSTGLLTIDAGSGYAIDGQQTRLLWAGESAVLYSNGTTWQKIAGRTRPLCCTLTLAANQTASANAGWLTVQLDSTVTDVVGTMADLTNRRIQIRRGGLYQVLGGVWGMGSGGAPVPTAVSYLMVAADRNTMTPFGSPIDVGSDSAPAGGYPSALLAGRPHPLAAGDYLRLSYALGAGAGTFLLAGGSAQARLSVVEVTQW